MNPLENYHVKDYLTDKIIIVEPETSVTDVYQKMQRERVRHIPVVSNGEPVGIISDRDVKFVSYSSGVVEMTAKDIMTPEPYVVTVNNSLKDVVKAMAKKKYGSAIIADANNKISGIFTSTDALTILAEAIPKEDEE